MSKPEESKEQLSVKLSPPWQIYYKQLAALFGEDPEIKLFFDEDTATIKLYVESSEKADALEMIVPETVNFGNVDINVQVIPADTNLTKHRTPDAASVFETAFKGNPAFVYAKTYRGIFTNPITYVVFAKKVVQFYSDDLTDINGFCSTLYEDIAVEVLNEIEGVYYCTDIEAGPPRICSSMITIGANN